MLLATTAAALTGCGVFSSPRESPVIEERVTDFGLRKIGILATTAERRAVIVKVPERLLCAEPPPDVGEAVASAFSAYLEAKGSNLPVEAKGGVSSAFGTAITQLGYRTQGLQLFRDGSFFLCNMYMNGVIDPGQYQAMRKELFDASLALIKDEIPKLDELRKQPLGSAVAPAVAASGPHTAASAAGPASAPR
jgi:hypothetical protein